MFRLRLFPGIRHWQNMKSMIRNLAVQFLEERRMLSISTGSLDPSFAETGIAEIQSIDLGSRRETPVMLRTSPDGGHYTLSHVETNDREVFVEVKKFNEDGLLDQEYGEDGQARLHLISTLHNYDAASDSVVQPDGKLLIAGGTSWSEKFAWIQRLNADGSVDLEFGKEGKIVNDDWFAFTSIAPTEDGGIVAFAPSIRDGFITKFDESGLPVETFGSNGTQYIRLNDSNHDVTVLANGDVIVASPRQIYGFDTDGRVNTEFGIDGSIVVPVQADPGSNYATAIMVESHGDGFVLAAPSADKQKTLVGRYGVDGRRDLEFGSNGWLEIDGVSPSRDRPTLAFNYDGSFWFGGEGYPDRLLHFSKSGELGTTIIETPNVRGFAGLTVSETGLLTVFTDEISQPPRLYSYEVSGSINHNFGQAGFTNVASSAQHSDVRAIDLATAESGVIYGLTRDTHRETYYLYRLNVAGSIDRSFGHEGRVDLTARIPVSLDHMVARRVFHGNDKIVVMFENLKQVLLQRFDVDGTLDPSFGFDGLVAFDLPVGSSDAAIYQDMLLEPDGAITLLFDMPDGNRRGYHVVRFDQNGTVQQFGEEAVKLTASLLRNGNDRGEICKVGDGYWMQLFSTPSSRHNNSELIRYDTEFNRHPNPQETDPILPDVDIPFLVSHSKSQLKCSPRRIVVGGAARTNDSGFGILEAYHPDGTPDLTFGTDGRVRFGAADATTSIRDLVLDSFGRITTASMLREADDYQLIFHRFTPDGSPDPSFGDNGSLIVNSSPGLDSIAFMERDNNGDILFAGSQKQGFDSGAIIGRIIGERAANSAWQNPKNVLDVDRDEHIVPADALAVINELNVRGSRLLPPYQITPTTDVFFDTNGDGWITPADAIAIINELNLQAINPSSNVAVQRSRLHTNWIDQALQQDFAASIDFDGSRQTRM